MPIDLDDRVEKLVQVLLSATDLANHGHNLLLDLNESPDACWDFLQELALAVPSVSSLTTPADGQAFYIDFCSSFHENRAPESFCKKTLSGTHSSSKSRIVRLSDMQYYEFGPFRGRGWGVAHLDIVSKELRENPAKLEAQISGTLRGACKNFFWFTDGESIRTLQNNQELDDDRSLGERIRDAMGFVNDLGAVEYIELELADDFVNSAGVARPTIVEGGFNSVYCSWSSADCPTGFTWDLHHSKRGLPEYVARSQNLKPGDVKLRHLARVLIEFLPYVDWSALAVRSGSFMDDLKTKFGVKA